MYPFLIICLLMKAFCVAFHNHNTSENKCCYSSERLTLNQSGYVCVRDTTRRLAVSADSEGFLRRNCDGNCVDAINTTNFVRLHIQQRQVVEVQSTGFDIFPKCCPMQYHYNSELHSCVKNTSTGLDFVKKRFVRVGLPHCKLIVDIQVDKVNNLEEIGEEACIDKDENGRFVRRECRDDPEICERIRCVKKCCPDGQSFINGPNCIDTYVNGLNMSFSDNIEDSSDPFVIISNRTCNKIYLMNERRYTFTLKRDGIFSYWQNSSNAFVSETIDNAFSYCIEHSSKANLTGFFFFKCFDEIPYEDKFRHTLWPKMLSCVFLGLTILIYLLLKETRNLFGMVLMNYCTATLLLYLLLVYAQVNLEPNDVHCRIIGFTIIFVSTVSFAWLNIMCCDIWLTFGYTRQTVGVHQKRRDCKRLIIYILCGWSIPAFHTLTIYAFSVSHILPETVHPYIGYSTCFIENRNYAAILFLRLPHFSIQIVNVVLFVKTINYCLKVKNEISRTCDVSKYEKRDRFKRNKEKLSLILKLSVIMGITFVFDTMTGFFRMSEMGDTLKYIEIIWDCINCLQGVFIFIIFICKKRIYREILRKLDFHNRSTSSTRTSYSTTRMSTLSTASRSSRTMSRRST